MAALDFSPNKPNRHLVKTFRVSTEIAAPPARVWDVMSDVERWHEWTPSITSITRLDDGPFGVGSRALVQQPGLPQATWEVTAFEPERGFTWVSTAPGVRVSGHHFAEPTPGGSRATLSVELQGMLSSLLALVTGKITEQYIALEASGLKARSEDPSFRHQGMPT